MPDVRVFRVQKDMRREESEDHPNRAAEPPHDGEVRQVVLDLNLHVPRVPPAGDPFRDEDGDDGLMDEDENRD